MHRNSGRTRGWLTISLLLITIELRLLLLLLLSVGALNFDNAAQLEVLKSLYKFTVLTSSDV